MSGNTLVAKVVTPYARALFDFSFEKKIIYQVTEDFQNLEILLGETPLLIDYLNNPVVNKAEKREVLIKSLHSQVSTEVLQFLMVLVNCERINLLKPIITHYLELVYKVASIKIIKISTAFIFTKLQKKTLIQKLKKLTNAQEIKLIITLDSNLIGGFLIQIDSKIMDFTVKARLQNLAKHLDTVLEI